MEQEPKADDGIAFSVGPALGAIVHFGLIKYPRQRCEICQKRRVLFAVGVNEQIHGPRLCSKCAGIH